MRWLICWTLHNWDTSLQYTCVLRDDLSLFSAGHSYMSEFWSASLVALLQLEIGTQDWWISAQDNLLPHGIAESCEHMGRRLVGGIYLFPRASKTIGRLLASQFRVLVHIGPRLRPNTAGLGRYTSESVHLIGRGLCGRSGVLELGPHSRIIPGVKIGHFRVDYVMGWRLDGGLLSFPVL